MLMAMLQGNCPACGAAVSFKSGSSIVVVCEYCHSVVARTDRALEDLGKVAELMETNSPLEVGLTGTYEGVPFELTGRAQLGHAAGGAWDEWYATFQNGWLGWLAEAQGRFYMTFQQPLPNPAEAPPFGRLLLGQQVWGVPSQVPLMVAETGRARALGAKAEIPYRLVPGETNFYADLSGAGGIFATLDYGEFPPLFFLGKEVTLAELGITATGKEREREARRVAAGHLNCPQCGGGLELRAPDSAERVTCPNCNSLLDVNQGKLKYLKSLLPGQFAPVIPIGAMGTFEGGQQLMVIGFVARSVLIDGTRYFWFEYLLYHPQVGFRWLVHSDNHWNFVETVPPGEVGEFVKTAQFGGKNFKIFQDAEARVEYVAGEFYWKVEVEERVRAVDYVAPPLMLSKEVSTTYVRTGGSSDNPELVATGEINWSLGKYVPVKEVEKAFNVRDLPRPSNVAPNQPFRHKAVYKYWLVLLPILLLVGLIATMFSGTSQRVMTSTYELPPLPNAEGTQVVFSEPFDLRSMRNVRVTAQPAGLDNSWLYMEGDLINEETGLVQTFPISVEYYQGVEEGESWTEGSKEDDKTLSALPAGKYTLRLEAQWEKWQQPMPVTVTVEQGATRGINLIIALIVLSIIPIFVLIWHIIFESRRWSESMFGGSSDDE
jgi:Zn finger protein HypA/HybF involved in hydrogenase expression